MPFITLEGIEGSGKSTQAPRLAAALGPEALLTREPGGTEIGRAIRSVLLDRRHRDMAPVTESLLYFADRAQHVAEVIRPALAAGRTVVCDRYVDSSVAYQGYGRGIPIAAVRAVADLATGGLRPDLTVFLDVPIETGLRRVAERGDHDRMESEVREFFERVRAGYALLMAEDPGRWMNVDGSGREADVGARVWRAVESRGLVPAGRHGLR